MINTTHHFGLLMPDDNEYVRVTDLNDNMYKLDGILYDMKTSNESQSDWNTNDTTKPSYVKNRPFYSEKVESDVWEFELPVINEVTGEGYFPIIPMPDADLSQFTDKQELNFYVTANSVSGDTHLTEDILYFCKNFNVRAIFEGIELDPDIPETLPCICSGNDNAPTEEERYYPVLVFGISIEYDIVNDAASVHYTPSCVTAIDTGENFHNNPSYPVQVHFENFRNKVEKVHQIPDKYINWDNYVNNNKKWKWEFHIPAMPFSTQPTIVTGNVSKLKADTFYFIKYTNPAETTFKLTYGEDVFVDDTLEFNRNDAWSSRDYYKFIHCISVDTENNTAIFGKPYIDSSLLPCIVPNNTKSLRIRTSARAVNMNINNSPIPQYDGSGLWGVGIIVLADVETFENNYETYGCFTQPTFDDSNNSVTMKETIMRGEGVGFLLSFASIPVCIIDPESEGEIAQITHPRYKGLLQYDVNITVADDRRSYNMEGTSTGVCWDLINSITFENSFNLSSIKATYPVQCYSQLKKEDKKLFFKTNEANNKPTVLAVSIDEDQVLTGFSITIEGEVE